MRFSLKWALFGVFYIAVAVAALSHRVWYYADLLWITTLVIYALSMVIALFSRGPRQVAAAGFVVFGGAFVACLEFAPLAVPTDRILYASGLVDEITLVPRSLQYQMSPGPAYRPLPVAPAYPPSRHQDNTSIYRAANTIAVAGLGLLGVVLATVLVRRYDLVPVPCSEAKLNTIESASWLGPRPGVR